MCLCTLHAVHYYLWAVAPLVSQPHIIFSPTSNSTLRAFGIFVLVMLTVVATVMSLAMPLLIEFRFVFHASVCSMCAYAHTLVNNDKTQPRRLNAISVMIVCKCLMHRSIDKSIFMRASWHRDRLTRYARRRCQNILKYIQSVCVFCRPASHHCNSTGRY